MRIRDYFYNAIAGIVGIAFIALLILGAISIGKGAHPADRCSEDDVWAAVSVDTVHGSGSHNRACVNAEEFAEATVADMAVRRGG